MKNLINLLIALLLVSTSLVACATPTKVIVGTASETATPTQPATETPTPTTEAEADLEGTLWTLDSYLNSEGESVDVLPDTGITLEFKDGKIGGRAGCNTYFASYEIEGDSLTVGVIGVTEMYCAPEALMTQEGEYLAALQSAALYRVVDDKLEIVNGDGETLLSFSALEPTPLTGTTWRLTGFNDGKGGFVSLLSGTEITALFGDDGNLSGSAGCNRYTASYEVEGETFSIGPVGVTRMMCAEPEGIMDQESAYLSMLESAAAYQIKGSSLEVRDADGKRLASYTAETVETTLLKGEWVLESFGPVGAEEAVVPGTEVTLQFGQENKINGSGGCNSYFGSYKTSAGNSLSIGEIGFTEMACLGEGVMEQEQQYFKALEKVSSFAMDQSHLRLFYGDEQSVLNFTLPRIGMPNPASVYCQDQGGRLEIRTKAGGAVGYCIFADGSECEEWAFFRGECAPASASSLSLEALKNATYPSQLEEGSTITLTNGRYEGEPFVEGGASRPVVILVEPVVFGDLDGDGVEDAAVILAANAGGSGTFISLEAVRNEGGEPVHLASYLLGDRVQIESLVIEGGQILLEMITHGPGDPMCCPTQLVRNVYALEGDTLIEVSSEVVGKAEEPSESTAQLTLEVLQNAVYPSEIEESGTITLTDGRYEGEPFVEGGASRPVVIFVEPVVFGDLDGDGVEDAAVILAANAGGSGTFISLEAVRNEGGEPVHLANYLLGDRVQIESLAIEGGQIVLEMITHGPGDPMCCPTQQVVQIYALRGDELVQISAQVISTDPATAPDIVGVVWNWQGFTDQSEQNDIIVTYPPAYRLELLPDGQFNFKADCNVGRGTFTLDDSSITLEAMVTTLAECGPASLYNQYLDLLGQAVTYVREGDTLTLNLTAGGGGMKFSKLHAVTGQVVTQGEATLPEGARLEVKVMDVTQGTPGTQVGGVLRDVTQFPMEFEATYHAPAIDPQNTYALQVTIKDKEGNSLYTNIQAYNVLTQDNPTYHIEVMVEPAG